MRHGYLVPPGERYRLSSHLLASPIYIFTSTAQDICSECEKQTERKCTGAQASPRARWTQRVPSHGLPSQQAAGAVALVCRVGCRPTAPARVEGCCRGFPASCAPPGARLRVTRCRAGIRRSARHRRRTVEARRRCHPRRRRTPRCPHRRGCRRLPCLLCLLAPASPHHSALPTLRSPSLARQAHARIASRLQASAPARLPPSPSHPGQKISSATRSRAAAEGSTRW